MKFTKAMRWVAAASVAAVLTVAAGTSPAKASVTRAFRGHTSGTIEFTSQTTATVTGSGQATRMGNFDRLEHVTLGAGGTVSGDITFTDDNNPGDQIFVEFSGSFVSANDVEGTYDITGGTGRFAGADGTATFHANTPDLVNMTGTWEGTIEY